MKMKIRGVKETEKLLTQTLTSSVRKGQRAGMNAAGTIIAKAQRAAVPPAKTKGYTTQRVKKAIGRKVFVRKGQLTLKVGVGVGKKKGTYRPSAVFLAAGTQDRFSGIKTIKRRNKKTGKYEVVRREKTGNPVRFLGRVKKSDFVRRGYDQTRSLARQTVVAKTKQTLARDAARRAGA
jgi:hypothetical protein